MLIHIISSQRLLILASICVARFNYLIRLIQFEGFSHHFEDGNSYRKL